MAEIEKYRAVRKERGELVCGMGTPPYGGLRDIVVDARVKGGRFIISLYQEDGEFNILSVREMEFDRSRLRWVLSLMESTQSFRTMIRANVESKSSSEEAISSHNIVVSSEGS